MATPSRFTFWKRFTHDHAHRQGTDTAPRQGTNTAPRQGTDTALRQGTDTAPRQGTTTVLRQGTDTAPRQGTTLVVPKAAEYLWALAPEGMRPHASGKFKLTLRITQAAALAIAVCFSLGATDAGSRYTDLNHRLMCTCGCAEILGECNHVGCPNSTGELNELKDGIAAGQSDKEILNSFVGRYGAVVLAAPTGQGFDVVAWIAPFAVFAAAMLGTILLVRRWTVGRTPVAVLDTATMDPAARELREKIRRETGDNGGF